MNQWRARLTTSFRLRSLNVKLLMTAVIALLVVTGASFVVNLADQHSSIRRDLVLDTHRSAREVAIIAAPILWNLDADSIWTLLESKATNLEVVQISIADRANNLYFGLQRPPGGSLHRIANPDQAPSDSQNFVVENRAITYNNAEIGQVSIRASSLEREKDLLSNMKNYVITEIGLSTAAIIAIMLVSQRIVRRIRHLDTVIAGFSENNLNVRAPVISHDEIGTLSKAFNAMADRVQGYSRNVEEQVVERTNRLIESEKLAFLGSLVAGVAHELNTPIGNCVTVSSWMQDRSKSVTALVQSGRLSRPALDQFLVDTTETFRILETNLGRAGEFIQAFKQIGTDQLLDETRRFGLRQNLQEMVTSLQPTVRKTGHTIVIDCPDTIVLSTSPGAVYQICSNVLMNALVHAFEPNQVGNISITVRLEKRPEDQEPMIHIDIADDGKGIAEPLLDQIFLPFFTTKRGAGGTGLGLSIVASICGNLGGTIRCQSAAKAGSVFQISLPAQLIA
jgi:two-component system NtrC family sensor kinase